MNETVLSPSNKPEMSDDTANHRAHVVGWLITGLGLFGVITYSLSLIAGTPTVVQDSFSLLGYALVALLGYFLLRFNQIAFGVFRFLMWFNAIFGGLYLLMTLVLMPYMLGIFAPSNFTSIIGIAVLLGFLITMISPIVSIALLIMTNHEKIRSLYT